MAAKEKLAPEEFFFGSPVPVSRHDQCVVSQSIQPGPGNCLVVLFASAGKACNDIITIDKAVAGKYDLRRQPFFFCSEADALAAVGMYV